jgi:hypothetical protein
VTTVDIRTPVSVPYGGGILTFEPDGRLTAAGPSGAEYTVVVPDFALSNLVELWCADGHVYVVGLAGRAVWFAVPSKGLLAEVLELDRLDLRGSYDPAGLHRIEFHKLADGDLLLIYELGLARLGHDGNARWQRVHDDMTAHFDRIAGGAAWLRGESGPFGFMLASGSPIVA